MSIKLYKFYAFVLLLFCSNSVSAVTFSGSISLPEGVTAPAGGVTVSVSTFPIEFNFDGLLITSSTDTVTIASGANSTNYSIEVSDGFSNGNVKLSFECGIDCTQLDLTSDGFVDTGSGVASLFSATDISTDLNQSVNIGLEAATVFSGSIQFPAGLTATGDENFFLRANSEARFSLTSYSTFIPVEPGATSITFSLGVPVDDGSDGWTLELSCLGCKAPLNTENFYPTTFTGNPLSLSENEAFVYSNVRNFRSLLFTLLTAALPAGNGAGSIAAILLLLDE